MDWLAGDTGASIPTMEFADGNAHAAAHPFAAA
jgi:hypothetical protein